MPSLGIQRVNLTTPNIPSTGGGGAGWDGGGINTCGDLALGGGRLGRGGGAIDPAGTLLTSSPPKLS